MVAQPSLDRFAIGFEVELAGIVPVLPAERDVRRARIERRAEPVDGRRPLAVDVAAVLVDDGVLAVAVEAPVLDDPRRVAFGGIERLDREDRDADELWRSIASAFVRRLPTRSDPGRPIDLERRT